jgi:futalosine hydrolase
VRILFATAVDAEAEAVRRGDPRLDVAAVGVGPAAAAAGAARLLSVAEARGTAYHGIVSVGIAGGFPDRIGPGGTVIADRSVYADLGAQGPDGFLSIDELGFGSAVHAVDERLTGFLRAALPGALVGGVLTVSTVTGTAERAAELRERWPDAVAETMEGAGVAAAALIHDIAYAELRTISNPVGPRDRASWQIGPALAALTAAASAIGARLEAL